MGKGIKIGKGIRETVECAERNAEDAGGGVWAGYTKWINEFRKKKRLGNNYDNLTAARWPLSNGRL
jgi:hypothetical protein